MFTEYMRDCFKEVWSNLRRLAMNTRLSSYMYRTKVMKLTCIGPAKSEPLQLDSLLGYLCSIQIFRPTPHNAMSIRIDLKIDRNLKPFRFIVKSMYGSCFMYSGVGVSSGHWEQNSFVASSSSWTLFSDISKIKAIYILFNLLVLAFNLLST